MFNRKPNEIPSDVAKARAVHAKKVELKERLEYELDQAGFEDMKTPSAESKKRVAELEIAYQKALLAVPRAQRIVALAEAEHAATMERADKERIAAAWKEVERYKSEGIKVSKELDGLAEQLVTTLFALQEIYQKGFQAIPEAEGRKMTDGVPLDSSLLGSGRLAGVFKLCLRKNGLLWITEWFDDPRKIPTMTENTRDAFGWALKYRNSQMAKPEPTAEIESPAATTTSSLPPPQSNIVDTGIPADRRPKKPKITMEIT